MAGVVTVGSEFIITVTRQTTDSLGNTSTYTSANLGGSWYNTAATGSGCSSCTVRGTISNVFDIFGNELSHTDELGHVTTYTYDSNYNVASVSQPLDTNTTVTTSYTYNSFGEPLTVTDALGNVTTNTYDGNGETRGQTERFPVVASLPDKPGTDKPGTDGTFSDIFVSRGSSSSCGGC